MTAQAIATVATSVAAIDIHTPPPSLDRVISRRAGFSQERFGNVDRMPAASMRKPRRAATKKYEIHSGRRIVSTQESVSALHAVVDYVRSYGVKDDEILRLGVDSVAWRGARFRAVPVDETSGSAT
jgi:hypothetical protein